MGRICPLIRGGNSQHPFIRGGLSGASSCRGAKTPKVQRRSSDPFWRGQECTKSPLDRWGIAECPLVRVGRREAFIGGMNAEAPLVKVRSLLS